MKKPSPLVLSVVATLALAACNNKPEVVDARSPDPMASQLANAAPVEPPPSIESTVSFRCQPGNTLLFVDFFKGGKMAALREEKGSMKSVLLKAPEAGQAYVAEGGYKLEGTAKAAKITLANGTVHTCKA
ncbi:hypothetical protein ACNFJ7_01220 [Sphingomonas sp. HT-1]|uniref:hypothetical protein n=1 Tax=unclassified Sphingomonas TaxID=196159 RepID=UPI00030DD279|nr:MULTISPECIES: hypothetical protein [unclassified Sphingomonas]KTF69758.1 hypothetical protein ATB93_07710 [Sphingomonas sp. WG]